MSKSLAFRPEIEALIQEIASRGDSILLRAPRDVYTALEDDVVGPRHSGLSIAERHLMAVYREEAAFVFRDLAWTRMAGRSFHGERLILRQTTTESAPRPDERGAAIAASRVLREATVELDAADQALLESNVSLQRAGSSDVVRLCAAAQRLSPTWNARLLTAQILMFEGRRHAAFVTATRALDAAPSSLARGITWNQIAEITSRDLDMRETRAASREAIRAHPELLSAHVGAIWIEIRREAADAAENGCGALADLIEHAPDAIDEHVRRLESLAGEMRTALGPKSIQLIRRLADRSPLAGRLFHAFSS